MSIIDILNNMERKRYVIQVPENGNGEKKILFGNSQIALKIIANPQDQKITTKIKEILFIVCCDVSDLHSSLLHSGRGVAKMSHSPGREFCV